MLALCPLLPNPAADLAVAGARITIQTTTTITG